MVANRQERGCGRQHRECSRVDRISGRTNGRGKRTKRGSNTSVVLVSYSCRTKIVLAVLDRQRSGVKATIWCSPWAKVKFSLIWRDKGRPCFSVSWMPMGHGNHGVEFQKCSYITFSAFSAKKTDVFSVTLLWHIFSRVGLCEGNITVFPSNNVCIL